MPTIPDMGKFATARGARPRLGYEARPSILAAPAEGGVLLRAFAVFAAKPTNFGIDCIGFGPSWPPYWKLGAQGDIRYDEATRAIRRRFKDRRALRSGAVGFHLIRFLLSLVLGILAFGTTPVRS